MSLPSEYLRRGLSDLKKASLLSLISYLMLFAMLLISLGIVTRADISEMLYDLRRIQTLLTLSGILIGFLISLLLGLFAFYKFFTATGHFKSHDPGLGIGRIGVILELIGLITIIIGATVFGALLSSREAYQGPPMLMETNLLALLGVLLFGAVLIVIGGVLYSVMLIRLGEIEVIDKLLKWAGILYLIGTLISLIPLINLVSVILGVVAMIILYYGCNSSLKSLDTVEMI